MMRTPTNMTTRRGARSTAAVVVAALLGAAIPAQAQDLTEALAQAAGVPQLDAFLPDKYSVEETDALPIDGVWTISTIKKKIRIERGRAYAVDSWLHMFVLKVQPDMVVLREFQREAPGRYSANDLPLLGPATFQLSPDGNLDVAVQGAMGPVKYKLLRREVDNETAFEQELAALAGGTAPPPPVEAPPPVIDDIPDASDDPLADCEELGVDPVTDDVVCLD